MAVERGRSSFERKWLRGFEEVFVGVLNEEKSKTDTEYSSMAFTYCSAGECFCTIVL